MQPRCRACGFEMLVIGESTVGLMCRRCDTTHLGNGLRWGPPNMPDTEHGRFTAFWKDDK